jgi:uncharacterized membrane protein YfhO
VLGHVAVDASAMEPLGGPPAPATVTVADRTVGRVQLDVDGQGPGPSFVAINQTWDDGWQATIDGAPTRLVRTEIDLSGVVVPPGRHHVELAYTDRWVDVGFRVSLASGLACLGLVLWGRRRRAVVTPLPGT